jgi:putative ABC transport system permease protein
MPFVLADLDYVLRHSGIAAPSEGWLRTDPSPAALARTLDAARARAAAASDERRFFEYPGLVPAFSPADSPVEAGIYGVVSIGFAIAVLFALLGFVAHAAFAQRQRARELAVLRALGLAAAQVRALLLAEDMVLLAAGVAGGLLGGALASGLFVPYLPLAGSTEIPFLVHVPWGYMAAFGGGLLVVVLVLFGVTAGLALSQRLAAALRLGD